MTERSSASAFAPATVANVSVGFDVLGFAMGAVGDRVQLTRTDVAGKVELEGIEGVVTDLPLDPQRNTASVALLAMIRDRGLDCGFRVRLHKGIPLGSGMGGSAASAVGAVVAANALLPQPLEPLELLPYAMAGEEVASGAPHADNAAPCLFGGLVVTVSTDPLEVVRLPLPPELRCTLVHPHMTIETRAARAVLRDSIPLAEHTRQTMHLSGFLTGCFEGNLERIGRSLRDEIVEPQRATLIPGFADAREAARSAGALALGIAGSGPSVFAWTAGDECAERVRQELLRTFAVHGLAADSWVGAIDAQGARVVP